MRRPCQPRNCEHPSGSLIRRRNDSHPGGESRSAGEGIKVRRPNRCCPGQPGSWLEPGFSKARFVFLCECDAGHDNLGEPPGPLGGSGYNLNF